MSALNGDGVDAWLELLDLDRRAGRKIAAVDYDTYAAGEAALGWLNAAAQLHADCTRSMGGVCQRSVGRHLQPTCVLPAAEIAHLKLYLGAGDDHVVGNLTANDAAIFLRGTSSPHAAKPGWCSMPGSIVIPTNCVGWWRPVCRP